MALLKGDAACTTGLAKRIYDYRWANRVALGLRTNNTEAIKLDCYCIACAVVDEIQTNATVTTSVPALGLVAPAGGGPVTGEAVGTGTVA